MEQVNAAAVVVVVVLVHEVFVLIFLVVELIFL